MIEALLTLLPSDWERYVEVAVTRPVRGVIDVVLARPAAGRIVSLEAHSEIRRLEQQLRWATEKSDALLAGLRPRLAHDSGEIGDSESRTRIDAGRESKTTAGSAVVDGA